MPDVDEEIWEHLEAMDEAKKAVESGHIKLFGRQVAPADFAQEIRSADPGERASRMAGLLSRAGAEIGGAGPPFDFAADFGDRRGAWRGIIYCRAAGRVTAPMIRSLRKAVPPDGAAAALSCEPLRGAALDEACRDPQVLLADIEQVQDWAKEAGILPCRKGSIARVRYGDEAGCMARVLSLDHEAGTASVQICHDRRKMALPIGSLEEARLHASDKDLRRATRAYEAFLREVSRSCPAFTEGMSTEVIDVHEDHHDMLRATRPELFDDSHPPLQEEEHPDGMIVRFENAHVNVTELECSCGHRMNESHYRTLCPHEAAALNHACTAGSKDTDSAMGRMSEAVRRLGRLRASNVARMSDAIYAELGSRGAAERAAFIRYMESYL
ncbi:MAG: hypothetical protein MPJ08_04115 [Nitrosopumilus sp.]|nr:hypothetical protein [Nitrosopumilus sp.]